MSERNQSASLGQSFSANPKIRITRFIVMLPAALMLLTSLLSGLSRIGAVYLPDQKLQEMHAPAMIFGFISALIILERAVAVSSSWALSGPLLLSVGSASIFLPVDPRIGMTLIVLGYAVLLVIYAVIWKRQAAIATAVQILGAIVGLISSAMWLFGFPFARVGVGALMFLVLTIIGERIELGRFAGLSLRGERVGLALSAALAASTVVAILSPNLGFRILGAVLLAVVIWLLVVDVARRTVRAKGATRYMAVAHLCGYFWLFVTGLVWLIGGVPEGSVYDATMHTVGLGFVMSMIMAHASVILPAVLRIKLPYRKWFYLPLLLLQISLAIRIAGDLLTEPMLRIVGGSLNVAAILLFLLSAVLSAVLAAKSSS